MSAFLGKLLDLVEMRERADDLRARLLVPTEHDDVRLANEMPTFIDGACERIIVSKYERDSNARSACIDRQGSSVCGLDFGQHYGPDAACLIHSRAPPRAAFRLPASA